MSFLSELFPPVLIEFKVNATEAISSLRSVNAELVKMQANAEKTGASLDLMTKTSKLAGTALLGIAGVAAGVGLASVETYDKILTSQSNLQVAIKNTGVAWKTAQPYVQAHVDAMSKLGFTYQDSEAALAKLTTATGSPAKALNSLGAVADLARAKQISLLSAANLLARAATGQARGLGDLGLAIKRTIPPGASFEQILAILEQRVGGTAENFKNTLPGALAITKAQFQQLEVQIGQALLPTLEKVADWLVSKGLPFIKNLFNWIMSHKGLVETVLTTLAALWVVPKIDALLGTLAKLAGAYDALAASAGAAALAEDAANSAGGFSAADRAVLDAIAGSGTAAAARRAAAAAAETAGGAAVTEGGAIAIAGASGGAAAAAATAAVLTPIALIVGKAVYDNMQAKKTATALDKAVSTTNLIDQVKAGGKNAEAARKALEKQLPAGQTTIGPAGPQNKKSVSPLEVAVDPVLAAVGGVIRNFGGWVKDAKNWANGGQATTYVPLTAKVASDTTVTAAAAAAAQAAAQQQQMNSLLAGKGITTYGTTKKPSYAVTKKLLVGNASGAGQQVFNFHIHNDTSSAAAKVTTQNKPLTTKSVVTNK